MERPAIVVYVDINVPMQSLRVLDAAQTAAFLGGVGAVVSATKPAPAPGGGE